ncbi:cytochrome c [Paracoccus sp. Z118]|uniref:c-type cytochrome n=1 Tax=Paracoccus sp. Z118 TaxID=2851017 RepID=UPI001C2C70E2|nr:cytochrome c [Paracoccus sp. Z118]MBV0893384.1 cytochrome c [Paracoccus sp. Z118]
MDMRSHLIAAALILAPVVVPAPTLAQGDAPAAHTPEQSPAAAGAPVADFVTFEPDPFESRLFLDPGKITQTEGEDIYRAVCQGCHMPEGEGAVGAGMYPALAWNENLIVGDYPVSVIVNGLRGMPPFRQVLDDQQIVAVVEYLQGTLSGVEVFPPTVETVEQARATADPLPH